MRYVTREEGRDLPVAFHGDERTAVGTPTHVTRGEVGRNGVGALAGISTVAQRHICGAGAAGKSRQQKTEWRHPTRKRLPECTVERQTLLSSLQGHAKRGKEERQPTRDNRKSCTHAPCSPLLCSVHHEVMKVFSALVVSSRIS